MSDRLELLKELKEYPAALKLATERLYSGESLLRKGQEMSKLPPQQRAEVKLALIIVRIWNPWEYFGAEEEAAFRGTSSDTINRHRKDLKPL